MGSNSSGESAVRAIHQIDTRYSTWVITRLARLERNRHADATFDSRQYRRSSETVTKPSAFTRDPQVVSTIADIRQIHRQRRFSDVHDSVGRQYVDLVMEGGGVLGVALVGYCYALEQAGIRFHSIAGTSAGAINALFMHAIAEPGAARSTAMIREISAMPLSAFIDGGRDARLAIDALTTGGSMLLKLGRLLPSLNDLSAHFGINPGDTFHQWIKERLAHFGITTMADLKRRLAQPPKGIRHQPADDRSPGDFQWRPELALIATELSTARKVVFPRDSILFYANPDAVSPADFVRASMAVPYFFEPLTIDALPNTAAAKRAWQSFKPRGPIPKQAVLVDGGLLSNFPIREFHRNDPAPPAMPTFGIKLGLDSGRVRTIDSLRAFTASLIEAMRFDSDLEFLQKNPDYRQLIGEINTDGYHWLNFEMPGTEQVGLFREGVLAAKRFLDEFDWPAYRESRTAGIRHHDDLPLNRAQ